MTITPTKLEDDYFKEYKKLGGKKNRKEYDILLDIKDEEIKKDLGICEQELFLTLVTTILYLNSNLGISMNIVRSLITKKVNMAFTVYKEENIKKDFEK